VIGLGLILMSFVVESYGFLCLAFGIAFTIQGKSVSLKKIVSEET